MHVSRPFALVTLCLAAAAIPIGYITGGFGSACACSPGATYISNAKQQVIALLLYSDDNDMSLPGAQAWMDRSLVYAKDGRDIYRYRPTEDPIKTHFGFAFNHALSRRSTLAETPAELPCTYTSSKLDWNATDDFSSWHRSKSLKSSPEKIIVGFLDGHAAKVARKKAAEIERDKKYVPAYSPTKN